MPSPTRDAHCGRHSWEVGCPGGALTIRELVAAEAAEGNLVSPPVRGTRNGSA